ncbi:MAG TPA: right-handed parallel beta-helix repeat-containing protein [Bacteroidota bacterium]|nr:right-handed parallel beta-helix repeat-containing protein [Bacteroidota bacterium]
MNPRLPLTFAVLALIRTAGAPAGEIHVSVRGTDAGDGSLLRPLRTITEAALRAQPGDVITVHAGTYRERINPPRGGESDDRRIVYRAAPGERVEIKGSEVVKRWTRVQGDLWTASLPNALFGSFNPYSDTIHGDWFDPMGRRHHTGAVYINGDWLDEAATQEELAAPSGARPRWYGRVGADSTAIWAQFPGANPNEQLVEINVRRTVFYPERTGVNYITVRGFIMRDAATNWAPPTAEQVGLIGPHWSRGWIIEDNVISHSRCSGVSLGKYGDAWDNTSENSAEGYVKTVVRALENGWNCEAVGHHIVRNNTITDCEQTGIVGSLGAVFSRIEGNTIANIWSRRLFTGAEIAGIKLHAAIDVVIRHNRIHDAGRGLWLDWMAQGTRVTGNLFYNHTMEDIFFEVDHGPFLVDNNLLLSPRSLSDASEGGAYVHNLFAGVIVTWPDLTRATPYHCAHSTAVAGLVNVHGGDDRFMNNIFAPLDAAVPREQCGLAMYDTVEQRLHAEGNVYYGGARPYAHETAPLVIAGVDPHPRLAHPGDALTLDADFGAGLLAHTVAMASTARLGRARIAGLGYENPDGSAIVLSADFFGQPRDTTRVLPGPFASPGRDGSLRIKVWQ